MKLVLILVLFSLNSFAQTVMDGNAVSKIERACIMDHTIVPLFERIFGQAEIVKNYQYARLSIDSGKRNEDG